MGSGALLGKGKPMWKKRLATAAALFGLFLALTAPAYAGGINAAEQSIIAYYSGTVSYNGKTYQFTEAAKQAAYNKLISDDVDLTEAQAAAAIGQANANLEQGISQGYLVEVTAGGGTDPGAADPAVPNPDDGNGSKNDETQGDRLEDSDGSEPEEDGEKKRPKYSDAQKADVNGVFKDSLEEGKYASVHAGSQKNGESVATVEQFLKGTVNVVAGNGDVVLSAGLPIKNTGYHTGKVAILPGALGIACLVLIAVFARKKKHYIIAPALCSVAGISLVWAFAGGILESEIGKWSSIWSLGTPEYAYAAEAGEPAGASDPRPLQGEQYGEIVCDEVSLRAPLYYGDTEEILKQGAGTYPGGSVPGSGGEILAGGHDAAVFAPLEFVKEGMTIQVRTSYGTYEYEVTGTKVIDVLDYDGPKDTEDAEELALYTCYPFGSEEKLRNERFFVYAKKVSGPQLGE